MGEQNMVLHLEHPASQWERYGKLNVASLDLSIVLDKCGVLLWAVVVLGGTGKQKGEGELQSWSCSIPDMLTYEHSKDSHALLSSALCARCLFMTCP